MKTIGSLKNFISKAFKINNNKVISDADSRANKMVVNLFKNDKSRNLTYMPNIEAIEKPTFSICNANKAFNYLK